MFKLNEIVETKNGEKLKPFAVQGNIVLCSNSEGETVKRVLTDFSFEQPKEKQVISVSPAKTISVDETKNDDNLFPEDKKKEETTDESTNETDGADNTTDTTQEDNTDENQSGSIWDDLNGDSYI